MAFQVFKAQLYRDVHLAFFKKQEWLNPLIFLVLVQSLFPLAMGAERQLLLEAAPAIIWVTALLSTLVSLDSLFREDFEDGTLEQMMLTGTPFYFFSLAKLFSHWLVAGLPLVLLCPILALGFYVEKTHLGIIALSLFLATPVLCCISALAKALTLNSRQGGVLLSLMILPLYVPVLVFGSGVISQSVAGESPLAALYMLAALFVFAVAVSPFVLSAALKLAIADS